MSDPVAIALGEKLRGEYKWHGATSPEVIAISNALRRLQLRKMKKKEYLALAKELGVELKDPI